MKQPVRLTDRGLVVVYVLTVAVTLALVWLTRDTCWVGPERGWYGSCSALMGGN